MYTDKQYQTAADRLGVHPSLVKAIEEVESTGEGFVGKEVKTLFEAHYFGKLTNYVHNARYPNLSGYEWDKSKYAKTHAGEQLRLQKAVAIDRDAALQSASWGAFQVLGANWQMLGYKNIQDFVNAVFTKEGQLETFVRFILAKGIDRNLRLLDFDGFCAVYNGPGYKKNNYVPKMKTAFIKYFQKETV